MGKTTTGDVTTARMPGAGTAMTAPTRTAVKTVQPVFTASGGSEIIYVEPGQTVSVQVAYPDASAGDTVLAQAVDGGDFLKDEKGNTPGVKVVTLDEHKTAGFTFEVGSSRGMYQVVLRHGLKTRVVQLWAGPPLAVAAE
jgi:hypothetical protein